jgi:hypothetical protein
MPLAMSFLCEVREMRARSVVEPVIDGSNERENQMSVHHGDGSGRGFIGDSTVSLQERGGVSSIRPGKGRSIAASMMAVLALAMTSIPAFSQTAYSFTTTLTTVGSQGVAAGGGEFYLQPATNPQSCSFGVIYIQPSAIGNGQYATALAAFYSGRSVRIDYTQDSTGLCTAGLVGGF